MIKLDNLNKYYNKGKSNEIHVVNDVNLELPSTGFISFIGPSGSGKTTLLNVIAGLDKAKGTITYDEVKVKHYNMKKIDAFRSRHIGYIFQNYHLLPEETVYNNLVIALELIGIYDKDEQAKRIEYNLKAVGMYKYRKKKAYALSGGQQQRVSIARALVKNSKIIIADEPTGNLDSENTIEIMNILKQISKKSLVVMVTHNEEIANFYSDKVIRLQDGKIAPYESNSQLKNLSNIHGNTIYLKDYQKVTLKDNNVNFNCYCDQDEMKNITINLVYRNGTFYIQADHNLKLAEQSNIKIIDKHYEDAKQEYLDDFDYDNSWYNNTYSKELGIKRFFQLLCKSFNKMRYAKKSGKLLNFAFVIIGILLAACAICYANFTVVDDTGITADNNYSYLYTEGPSNYSIEYKTLEEGFKNNYISNAQIPVKVIGTVTKSINFNETTIYSFPLSLISSLDNSHQVRIGALPQKGEILISRKYADEIIKKNTKYFPDYESLIGFEVLLTADEDNEESYNFDEVRFLKISGISENTTNLAYIDDSDYMSMLGKSIFMEHYVDIIWRDWQIENLYGKTYTIVAGRDMNESDINTHNILIPSSFLNAESYVNQPYIVEKKPYDTSPLPPEEYFVVGVYELNGYRSNSKEFIGSFTNEIEYNFFTNSNQASSAHEYTLLKGKHPENFNECITSIYSGYKIGDELYNGKVVVGKYTGGYETTKSCVLYHRDYVISENYPGFWFKIHDLANLENILDKTIEENKPSIPMSEEISFNFLNSYEAEVTPLREEQKADMMLFGILSIGILIILAIIIYFMMRGRMIADISHIGVYRSLGQSRGKIISEYIIDILLTVSLTSLIGFLLSIFIFSSIVVNMNRTILISAADKAIELIPLGILLLYSMNIFFGITPIINLLKMTPAEINTKYDM